jgi:hypothetical protein
MHSNIRSPGYYIATAESRCGRCGRATLSVAVAMPAGHETLHPESDDEGAAGAWQQMPLPAVIFDVYYFSDSVRALLALRSPHYRPVPNGPEGGVTWLNHCEHCGVAEDEQELHGEADAAFSPMSPQAGSTIRLEHVAAEFHGGASGYSHDPAHFDFPARS